MTETSNSPDPFKPMFRLPIPIFLCYDAVISEVAGPSASTSDLRFRSPSHRYAWITNEHAWRAYLCKTHYSGRFAQACMTLTFGTCYPILNTVTSAVIAGWLRSWFALRANDIRNPRELSNRGHRRPAYLNAQSYTMLLRD